VICSSHMVRDEIRRRFAVPESKLHVVYNPVDSTFFHPDLRAGRPKLLAAHRIDSRAIVYLAVAGEPEARAAGTAIDALASVPAPAHLIVVGGDLEHHRRRAHSLGIADRLTLIGPQANLSPYYGAADVFVQSALYDPSPGIALEAMSCGLALVTSAKSGAAELAREHDGGLVFPTGDATALAAHMRTLLDEQTRARFGANARRAVLPLTPEATTVALVLMYRDLLAPAAPGTDATTTRGG